MARLPGPERSPERRMGALAVEEKVRVPAARVRGAPMVWRLGD